MPSRKPVVLLNMSLAEVPASARVDVLAPVSYADSVSAAGGLPIFLPPSRDLAALRQALALCQAVLFIGGDDYWPEHYGGNPQPATELLLERRDRFDWRFARLVLQRTRLPVLAICGGQQLLCIACGGALVQDIRKEWKPADSAAPLPHSKSERSGDAAFSFRHLVRVAPDSLLRRACMSSGGDTLPTNSFHHQAVRPDRLGRGLRASAWASDGVVEALEPALDSRWARTGRFVLGVQWHPERMADAAPQRRLFRSFVAAARAFGRRP